MIELPPASGDLAPTTVALEAALDALVLRNLEPLIDAIGELLDRGRSSSSPDGEPDGFDGITRNGDLSRLLPSEWLLVAEEPDEFVRRFERRELGFLRTRRRQPSVAPTSLVVFDNGPSQLGRPRVAHLALLIVLARCAEEHHTSLRWGLLDRLERREVSGGTAGDLIRSRTASMEPAPDQIDLLADDALVVTPTPCGASHELRLVEAANGLQATLVNNRSGTTTTAMLELPAPDVCVRVLRNVQGSALEAPNPTGRRQVPEGVTPGPGLVFDVPSNKLLCRSDDEHSLLVFPSPNSANDRTGPVRFFEVAPQFGRILAAGRRGKFVFALQMADDDLFLTAQGRDQGWPPRGRINVRWEPPAETMSHGLGELWFEGQTVHALVLGRHLVLERARFEEVNALHPADRWRRAGSTDIRFDGLSGTLLVDGNELAIDLEGVEVVGCGVRGLDGPGVFAVAPDRRTIQFLNGRVRRTVAVAPSAIAEATTARNRVRVAARTVDGRVFIWDWTTGTKLYEWQG